MCFVPVLDSQRGLSELLPVDTEIDRRVGSEMINIDESRNSS